MFAMAIIIGRSNFFTLERPCSYRKPNFKTNAKAVSIHSEENCSQHSHY